MATFTSIQSGDWNDGAAWGNSSPGSKGIDWPGAVGDVVNVEHSICYNVSETNELGDLTVTSGGDLYFSGSTNTKLTFGHANFTVNSCAKLTVGKSGDIIPCSYTAEIWWNTTADNAKGLFGGGIDGISFFGDGAYYGSSFLAFVANTWQGGLTFTVSGNLYDKWNSGQSILIHNYGKTYLAWYNSIREFTISSIWNNGGNTTILINETAPGSTNVFNAGGRVLNLSRNIRLGKLNYDSGVRSFNTNRPRIDITESTSNTHFEADNVAFCGFHRCEVDQGMLLRNCIFRNGYYGIYHVAYSTFDNIITYSNKYGTYITDLSEFNNYFVVANDHGLYNCEKCIVNSIVVYANQYAIRNQMNSDITGLCYHNQGGFRGCEKCKISIDGWSNSILIYTSKELEFINGSFDYDEYGNIKSNAYECYFNVTGDNYIKYTTVRTPSTYLYRNQNTYESALYYSNYNEIPHNLYVAHNLYDLSKDTTTTRSGGADYSFKVSPFSNIIHRKIYLIKDWYEYDLEAGVETVRYVYIMGLGWTTFPRSGRLCLEADYYDQTSGSHCATIVSTTMLTQNSVWTPFQITFTPAQSWHVNYKIYLQDYDTTSSHIYIDNQIRNEL